MIIRRSRCLRFSRFFNAMWGHYDSSVVTGCVSLLDIFRSFFLNFDFLAPSPGPEKAEKHLRYRSWSRTFKIKFSQFDPAKGRVRLNFYCPFNFNFKFLL